ncbi:MAG: hypothetical protein AAGA23_02570 [Pseudomonadota bacterium]
MSGNGPLTLADCRAVVREDIGELPAGLHPSRSLNDSSGGSDMWGRIVVAVPSCAATQPRLSNYLSIFEPWFEALGLAYFVVLAHPTVPAKDDYLVLPDSRVFVVRAKEGYETLAHKLVVFYDYVLRETDYTHVLKCDDGCLLNLANAASMLELDYAGTIIQPTLNTIHQGRCADTSLNQVALDLTHGLSDIARGGPGGERIELGKIDYAAGGYAYRLSRAALHAVTRHRSRIESLTLSYEDLLFGQLCAIGGFAVSPLNLGRYHRIAGTEC